MMETKWYMLHIRRPLTREEMKRERRWRIVENVVNVLLGLAIAAGLFWCGWQIGSGVVGF